MKVKLSRSLVGCENEALWLLSENNAKKNSFLIAGGVLAALLVVYVFFIVNFCATEQSPLRRLMKIGSVRKRELWINMSFAIALVALNLLLLGGIQKNFKETFIAIMVAFGLFSIVCSFFGIRLVAIRLIKPSSTVVHNATEFITGTIDAACTNKMFASDRYQDFGNDIFGTLWLGIAQVILLGMYVVAAYVDLSTEINYTAERRMQISSETEANTEADFLAARKNIFAPFYALAIFVQIGYVFGKDTVKEKFKHILFWGKAYRAWWDKNVYDWKSRDASSIRAMELFMRSLLSIMINDVGLIILLVVLPLQLSVMSKNDCFDFADKASDFVLNAVAIYYVVELDNIEEKIYKIKKDKVGKLSSSDDSVSKGVGQYDSRSKGAENGNKAEGSFFLEDSEARRSVPV